MFGDMFSTAPAQSQNSVTPDANNSLAGKGGGGGGGGVGTTPTGSNQPAPFGIPAGLGNPSVGAGIGPTRQVGQALPGQMPGSGYAGFPGQSNNIGQMNPMDMMNAYQQAVFGGNQPGPMPEQPPAQSWTVNGNFPAMGGMPSPVLQNPVGGPAPVPSPKFGPTRQVGAALPGQMPGQMPGQPSTMPVPPGLGRLMPTKQVGAALPNMGQMPGQPSTMPVNPNVGRLPAPAKLTPLQPNFRTGGVTRF
jgi:hypothetical protein